MKKLMFAVATAAMVGGAFAACGDSKADSGCVVWDLSLKLKTVAPKKMTCKDTCGDKSTLYYLDGATRTLKGYLWDCEYACDTAGSWHVTIWDAKNQKAVIALPPYLDQSFQDADFTDLFVYGKKATSVAGNIVFAGTDADAEDGIEVQAAGIGGKIASRASDCTDCLCFIKSLSGYAAGKLQVILPNSGTTQVVGTSTSGFCGDGDVEICEDEVETYPVVVASLCDVCCNFTNYCDEDCVEELTDLMVPAVGTWSMKYNKKASTSGKTVWDLAPAYAR